MVPDPQAAVGIDAPGQLDPELVLFPDLARVSLVGEGHGIAHAPPRLAQDGLAKPDPGARVGLVADDVVALAGVAHGQHVIGEIGRLVPRGGQGRVESYLLLVAQRLDPGEPVGVCPHGIEHPGEVDGQLSAPLFQEMGQEKAHLVMGEGVFLREMQFVPELLVRGMVEDVGLELVPPARRCPALRADTAREHVQEVEAPRHGPAAGVAAARAAPVMGSKARPRPADLAGDLHDLRRRHAALLLGELGGVFAVDGLERFDEPLEGARRVGVFLLQVGLPVHPRLHEFTVVEAVLQNDVGHGQQYRGLATRIGGHPVVGHAGRVGQPRVHDGELRALHHALDDALGMGIEVVSRFQVGADEEDEPRVGVVRRRPVEEVPEGVAEPGARRADVGVAVVPVHAPGLEHAVDVAFGAGPAHVIGDFVVGALLQPFADSPGDVVQCVVPGHPFPLAAAPGARPAHGIENAVGVADLVDGRRALGAIPTPAGRVVGIALELADLHRLLVHVAQHAASCFAVEAGRGHHHVAFGLLPRPVLGLVLHPVVPLVRRRVVRERTALGQTREIRSVLFVQVGDQADLLGQQFDQSRFVAYGHVVGSSLDGRRRAGRRRTFQLSGMSCGALTHTYSVA